MKKRFKKFSTIIITIILVAMMTSAVYAEEIYEDAAVDLCSVDEVATLESVESEMATIASATGNGNFSSTYDNMSLVGTNTTSEQNTKLTAEGTTTQLTTGPIVADGGFDTIGTVYLIYFNGRVYWMSYKYQKTNIKMNRTEILATDFIKDSNGLITGFQTDNGVVNTYTENEIKNLLGINSSTTPTNPEENNNPNPENQNPNIDTSKSVSSWEINSEKLTVSVKTSENDATNVSPITNVFTYIDKVEKDENGSLWILYSDKQLDVYNPAVDMNRVANKADYVDRFTYQDGKLSGYVDENGNQNSLWSVTEIAEQMQKQPLHRVKVVGNGSVAKGNVVEFIDRTGQIVNSENYKLYMYKYTKVTDDSVTIKINGKKYSKIRFCSFSDDGKIKFWNGKKNKPTYTINFTEKKNGKGYKNKKVKFLKKTKEFHIDQNNICDYLINKNDEKINASNAESMNSSGSGKDPVRS